MSQKAIVINIEAQIKTNNFQSEWKRKYDEICEKNLPSPELSNS